MTQRFYINSDGTYAGSYDGPDNNNPHAGKVEVPSCPISSKLIWNGTQWTGHEELKQAKLDRENNKASAKAKLAALGLTEAEIKDTFGI